jgi:hypothetical protein
MKPQLLGLFFIFLPIIFLPFPSIKLLCKSWWYFDRWLWTLRWTIWNFEIDFTNFEVIIVNLLWRLAIVFNHQHITS